MYRTDFWTLRERERVGWFGRMALKHVYYHVRNESPVYVWYRIQDAWGWCTGMIQRDDMEWEVGGGFMIGNSCTPMVDSCYCMAKPIQYCKAPAITKEQSRFPTISLFLSNCSSRNSLQLTLSTENNFFSEENSRKRIKDTPSVLTSGLAMQHMCP